MDGYRHLLLNVSQKVSNILEGQVAGKPGVLLGTLGWGVSPGSPKPDPIPDQNMPFSAVVFRPGL